MSSSITEQQLRAFLAVAKCGSFTKAAEALAYSQPAVSLHVKALESALGRELFERCGSRVRLTWFGSQLQDVAVEVLDGIEALWTQLRLAVEECAVQDQDEVLSGGRENSG